MGTASHGRSPDDPSQWLYFPEATPARRNTTKGFTEIDKNSERILPTLADQRGENECEQRDRMPKFRSDWIELLNTGF